MVSEVSSDVENWAFCFAVVAWGEGLTRCEKGVWTWDERGEPGGGKGVWLAGGEGRGRQLDIHSTLRCFVAYAKYLFRLDVGP